MKVGYYPGVWDLIHVGHLRALQAASSQCDKLIVGVPSEDVVFRDKGHIPIIPTEQRVEMLEALPWVDSTHIYLELEFISALAYWQPSILFIGGRWGNEQRHQNATEWMEQRCKEVSIIDYTVGVSTTNIIRRVIKLHTNYIRNESSQ